MTRLVSVRYRCSECDATHVRPEYIDGEEPEKTREGTCYAAHPARDAGFEGCGEEVALEAIEWREDRDDEWTPIGEDQQLVTDGGDIGVEVKNGTLPAAARRLDDDETESCAYECDRDADYQILWDGGIEFYCCKQCSQDARLWPEDGLVDVDYAAEKARQKDVATDGGEPEPVPLYRRDEAPVNRDTDLILILADQAGTTYRQIREQLENIDFEVFEFELRVPTGEPVPADLGPGAQPAIREPYATLWFLETLGYIPEFYPPIDVEEPIETTEKGHAAAETLCAGLTDEQVTAIEEVRQNGAAADGGEEVSR
ncbi:hypothetical protein [Halobellus sp. H-GB7]|uniref:hypothetical protein n=1 Tax=Halobellus sp. H-GB7 TaxID=3069756 RepID=UPI0027B41928|nr:hypothetical protein [Halobellus sp. H-GB7]MDQ2054301.1 hypothetical protein [Halobellus sp. H-GB7]